MFMYRSAHVLNVFILLIFWRGQISCLYLTHSSCVHFRDDLKMTWTILLGSRRQADTAQGLYKFHSIRHFRAEKIATCPISIFQVDIPLQFVVCSPKNLYFFLVRSIKFMELKGLYAVDNCTERIFAAILATTKKPRHPSKVFYLEASL